MKRMMLAAMLIVTLGGLSGCAAMMGYNQYQGPHHRPLVMDASGNQREMTEAEVLDLWRQHNTSVYVDGKLYTVRIR